MSAALLWAGSAIAAAPSAAQITQARIAGLAWLMSNQQRDGSWHLGNSPSVQSSSAVIDAFANAGLRQGFPYAAALAYLGNVESVSVDALARQIATLRNAGKPVAPMVARLNQWQNGNAAWGAYKGYGSSLPDTPLALTALLKSNSINTTTIFGTLCAGILSAQRANFSFPYAAGAVTGTNAPGALIPTAYAAVALNGVRTTLGYTNVTCSATYALGTTVTNAVNWMLGRQSAADGGFADVGPSSALETAIVYLALQQIGPTTYATAMGNAQGYLVASQSANGSWGGDAFTTALALQTLPALTAGTLLDTNKNGVPDSVEAFLGRNPSLPDRTLADGNGQSVVGLTSSQLIASGIQFQAFSASLATAGGSAPYTWRLVSGFLPDGLVLGSGTGQLLGTPGTAGVFSFVYEVSDAAGGKTERAVQVAIAAADGDVPTLPEWGLILLTGLLATSMARHRRRHSSAR